MSKTRIPAPRRGARSIAQRVKFKIGGRKARTNAATMTSDALVKLYNETNTRGRDKAKIARVLAGRGVTDLSLPEEAVE